MPKDGGIAAQPGGLVDQAEQRRRSTNLLAQITVPAVPGLRIVLAGGAFAQDCDVDCHTIGCSVDILSTGDDFELSGTVDPADAGAMTDGTLERAGG